MTKSIAMMLIAGGLGAGIASAEPVTVYGATGPQARVSYADLDIGSSKGVERLQDRIRSAASDICIEPTKEEVKMTVARKQCYNAAVHDGFGQVDALVANRLAGKASLSTAILISAR